MTSGSIPAARDDGSGAAWTWTHEDDGWVPPLVDDSRPSVARMYDYFLGGKDNYAIDRETAEQALRAAPETRQLARANRTFLIDTVRELARAGIRQFVDLGTGIPTSPNVHETAREVHPDAAVVYVDNDPVVLAHNRALLRADDRVVTVAHDLRRPESVLGDPAVRALLDLDRPVGVLLVSVVHFVELDTAPEIVARYLRELAPGSRLAITAACGDEVDEDVRLRIEAIYRHSTAPFVYRTREQIEALLTVCGLVPADLVRVYRSRTAHLLGGVAVKP